jgi:hypothetical protein
MEEEKMTEHESVVLEWSVSEAWDFWRLASRPLRLGSHKATPHFGSPRRCAAGIRTSDSRQEADTKLSNSAESSVTIPRPRCSSEIR